MIATRRPLHFPTQGGECSATLHPASSLSSKSRRRWQRLRADSAELVHIGAEARSRHDPAPRQEDVQALRRRRVPALRVRAHVRGRGPERRPCLAEGRARRGPRRPRGVPRLVGHDRLQPRPGPLPARRDDGGARDRPRRASARAGRRSRPRSIASSGTRAGRTSSRRCSAARTPSPARTSTSPCPSRPASSRCSRRTSRRSRPRLAHPPGARRRQHRRRRRRRAAPARRGRARRGARDLRRPRGASTSSPAPRGARALARRAHGRERDRPHRANGDSRSSSGWPRTTSSASSARRPTRRARGRSRRSSS